MSQDDGVKRRVPLDIVVVFALLLLTLAVVASPVSGLLQTVVVLVFLLFIPGYAFTTAVFPLNSDDGIDSLERAALALGLSMVWLPVLLLVAPTPDGLSTWLVVGVTASGTLIFVLVAVLRHLRLPSSRRCASNVAPLRSHLSSVLDLSNKFGTLLSVVLLVSALLALGGFGYALVVPKADATSYTSVSLLTENGARYVAEDYPAHVQPGEPVELTLSIENLERTSTEYTVLVTFDQMNESGSVVERTRVRRFRERVPPGDAWNWTHTVERPPGGRLRLTYLVFVSEPPENPSVDNAYRSVYLWMESGGKRENRADARFCCAK